MKYVSITNNLRGFNTQTDWNSYEDWKIAMEKEEKGHREYNWSIIIFVPSGNPTAKYSRGREIMLLK